MPATEITPKGKETPGLPPTTGDLYDSQSWESVYRDLHTTPALLVQLQDDLSRSRKREAFWVSVVLHLTIVILLGNAERIRGYFPARRVQIKVPAELLQQKELTYLEQPPVQQKVPKRPDTNIISDKDRIATSRTPRLDPKELKKILDSARPGPPGQPTPPVQQQGQQEVAQNPPAQSPQPDRSAQPPDNNQTAALRTPPRPQPSFNTGNLSAGSAIEQAARAALSNPSFGGGGNYGLGQGRQANAQMGPLDVMSDTMGVDFGPYLSRVLNDVRANWYNLIPEAARPPLMKRGKVSIEFAITKDGKIGDMRLTGPSGDISLDRAAWGGITASNPFPPLPNEFRGEYLALRFHFYYNPETTDIR